MHRVGRNVEMFGFDCLLDTVPESANVAMVVASLCIDVPSTAGNPVRVGMEQAGGEIVSQGRFRRSYWMSI